MNYRIFIDMDGVLAVWDRRGSDQPYDHIPPLYRQPKEHFFRTLKPDPFMVQVLKHLQQTRHAIYIISQVYPKGSVAVPTIQDKKQWIKNHIPYFDLNHFVPVIGEAPHRKREAVEQIFEITHRPTFFIDDRNENLQHWKSKNTNFIDIKYLNGDNEEHTYDGPMIDRDMTLADIESFLHLLTYTTDATL